VIRAGIGFDAHAFDSSRPLMLGGIHIPAHPGLAGHSDADVVAHAIADALLGAAGLGDLGSNFPASDEYRDASSMDILAEIRARLRSDGWSVGNVDATIVAATPRVSDLRDRMQKQIAVAIDVPADAVSIKATTTDGLGFIGAEGGIAAVAITLIERSTD
jgi:2-C-methyl-D-erythritol 2,4-cyclodiphosphate synthase